jgi:hypothetical protein
MKSNFSKWLAFTTAIIIFAGLSSCVKPRAGYTDFSDLQDFVIFQNGGLRTFAASNVSAGPSSADTVTTSAIITLASKNVSSTPLTVKVGVDDTKRTDYNTANGTSYQAPTSSMYRIVNPTVTIPAGQNYATVKVEFYGKKLDPSVSYLLPLSILDASGKQLSANENTVYYNIIGNPIAGNYSENWRRWASFDTTTAPALNLNTTVVFSPETSKQILVESNENGADFHISFTNTNGVLTNFKVTLDPASYGTFGLGSLTTPAVLLKADPINGVYSIFFQYVNTGGANRSIVEIFRKI